MLDALSLLVVLYLAYMAPAMLALARCRHDAMMIFAVNVLLGWTVAGWIARFGLGSAEGQRRTAKFDPPQSHEEECADMKFVSLLALGIVSLSVGSASAALNYDRVNYFKPGKHQIYVWCTGGVPDTSVTVEAANAEEAIRKAVAGKPNCWGVWQGLNV